MCVVCWIVSTGCGASRLLQFVQRYISTIGVDFGVKPVTVSGREVKVNFWDLSGHPDFFEVRNEFYKDAQGVRTGALLLRSIVE